MAGLTLPSSGALAALPFTAASLAYLSARWSVPNDWRIIRNLTASNIRWARRVKQNTCNAFYPLETHALSSNPSISNGHFLLYEDQKWTFRQTYDLTLRYAGWLHQTMHIQPGEIVALDFMNGPHFIFLTLALWSLGAVPAYINYNLTGDALVHCVRVSTARILLVDPQIQSNLTEKVRTAFADPKFRRGSFPLEVKVLDSSFATSLPYFPPYRAPDSARETAPRSPGALIFTSGTTGLPKAAVMPWERFGQGVFIAGWQGLRPVHKSDADVFYTAMPLYHSSALLCCFSGCLATGATMALGRKFSATGFWEDVRRHDATVVQYVGETLRYLLSTPPSPLDKEHKVRMAFGNGLRPDVWERFQTRFGVETVAEFYSATEGTSGSWNYSSNDFARGAVGRNGRLLDHLLRRETAVVRVDWEAESPWRDAEQGHCVRVPRGEMGELLYAVDAKKIEEKFAGYFDNKAASERKILRDVFASGDAWFRTGDVVRWDNEGRWWFMDRLGDTFRWRGENVSTAEVGQCLGLCEGVVEANVYGVQVPGVEGRAGCAAVLLQGNNMTQGGEKERAKEREILDALARHALAELPKYAVPVFVRVVSEIMATGNNKQQKHVLREEGVDPAKVAKNGKGDRLYWLQGGKYTEFGVKQWTEVLGGRARL